MYRSEAILTEVTDVTVSANGWDERTDGFGCTPAGCVAVNILDGSTAPESRWSCNAVKQLLLFCELTFEFGLPQDIAEIRMALHKGDERTRSVNVLVDGELVTTVMSSGMTLSYESYELIAPQATTIVLQAAGSRNDWLSITEVSRHVANESSVRICTV